MNTEIDNSFISSADLIKNAKIIIENIAQKDGLSGVPTGFEMLDGITSGWQPSDLIIIAGRPSIGKSAFVLSMINNVSSRFGVPVAFFSPEMSSTQIAYRLISSETGLSLSKLRSGKLENHEWKQLSVNVRNLEKAPLYIDDTYNLSIQRLSSMSRELVEEKNIQLIVIDNIHLLSCGEIEKGNFTREQEISTIARNLKALAKELSIPIVVVSQLSREIESRSYHKRPILNDLRGSGTLEEIADIVSFIYRPEYYKIDEWDDDEQSPTQGQAEFIIAKHRNGSLVNIRFKFTENIGKFDNLEDFGGGFDDFPTKMNLDDNPFFTKNLPSANEAFGSNINSDDDSDVPF